MTFLVRAVYVFPYAPGYNQYAHVVNAAALRQMLRYVTTDKILSVQSFSDSEEAGEKQIQELGVQLQEIMECDVKCTSYVTPLGSVTRRYSEFNRKSKPLPVVSVAEVEKPELRICVSASVGPKGSYGDFSVSYKGVSQFVKVGIALEQTSDLLQANASILVKAVDAAEQFCLGEYVDSKSLSIIVVSPSEFLVKTFRDGWKMSSAVMTMVEANTKLSRCFNRDSVKFVWSKELKSAA